MIQYKCRTGTEQEPRRWRSAEFVGLVVFILICVAVLPFVRDSYILQDVWVSLCGAIGIN
ncbi:hypothetical protein [Nisaea nitritireducens]|uniref:hypothetical protein n=1 Tax=Nisaea nitritireducens TaxID=568392 RepID=UPI0018661968|nr:hypothetical protein [Nisaea nitritireducens]